MRAFGFIHSLTLLAMASIFVLSGSSQVFAFDCAKAKSPIELAICANPSLKTLDDNMELVHFSMKRRLDPPAGKILKSGQRHWLQFRNEKCGAEPDCLIEETQNRLNTLDTVASRTPEMVPVFIWQKGSKNAYDVKINGSKFANADTPAKSRFNIEFEKLVKSAPLDEVTEDQNIGSWEQEISMAVTQLTDRMVSATAYTYDYSGGAHPNSWTLSINVNMQTGELLETRHLFTKNATGKIISQCRDQIILAKSHTYDGLSQAARNEIEEHYPGVVAEHVTDMGRWHFDESGATIRFDSYAIGAYVEGNYECRFSIGEIENLSHDIGLLAR